MSAVNTAPPKSALGTDVWAIIATFGAYFCMYMYRKPFSAATFEDLTFMGMAYKPIALISQVLGYTVSKFVGIKVISELSPGKKVSYYLGMIAVAEFALILFGITPAPFNVVWLFLNGLPLGMVFGLVLSSLEGRMRTEALTACLCASFVIADGVAKSSGLWLIGQGVTEQWMPAATGVMYLPGIILFGWMLSRISPPSTADVEARSERTQMDKTARREFFRKFGFGLTLLITTYALVGVLRGVRSDFSREIWEAMGTKVDASLFSRSELIVALSVLLVIGFLVVIRDNAKAFQAGLWLSGSGLGIVILSLLGRQTGLLDPFLFIVVIGFGLYLPYIAIHATVFERLIAYTREKATIGYLMYVADAVSYAALVGVFLLKNFGKADAAQVLPFFLGLSWLVAIAGILMLIPTAKFFSARGRNS